MDGLDAISETAGAAAVEAAVAALVERGDRVHPCTNCAAPLIGPYCAACGQPIEMHRRSILHLLHDLLKDVASFDSRILRTVRALLFVPGELPLAFRQGRTQRYVPAVRLYLFVSLAFFLVLASARIAIVQFVPSARLEKVEVVNGQHYLVTPGDDDPDDRIKAPAWYDLTKPHYSISINNAIFFAREGAYHADVPAAALSNMESKIARDAADKNRSRAWLRTTIQRSVEDLAKNPAALNGALTAWIPRALFFLLPAFALLLAAFYWRPRGKFFYVDHLVFSLNFHAFGFALLLVAAGLAQVLPGAPVAIAAAMALSLYLLLAQKRFYGQNWFWTATKFLTIEFLYATCLLFPALITILVLSVVYG